MGHFCCHEPKFYVAKARTRRKVKPTYHKITHLSKKGAGLVHLDLVKGIKSFKKGLSIDQITAAVKSGSLAHVLAEIPWASLHDKIAPAAAKMRDTNFDSIKAAITALPPQINSGLRMDMANPFYQRYTEKRIGSMIEDVTSHTQGIVQDAVIESLQGALTPREVADRVVDHIGLDSRRSMALINYENGLRDEGVEEKRIDSLVSEYGDRLLDQRAMTIARSETRAVANDGQLAVWQEAADQGLVDKNQAKKVWIVDGNPCEICEPMDGIAVGLYDTWTLNTGEEVDIPSDAHPNCYCGMELDFGDGEDQDEVA